ncbi:nicotinamide mononucleotide transporter [candidate division KSB1 bacterium]|nr:nicotinamide mononucleotide transporter [candidate division KSB1 bacterium]
MNQYIEIAANLFNAGSILLAGMNSQHTWWTGIIGCVLFTIVFGSVRLYADVTLQVFFIATGFFGWWNWLHGRKGKELPVRRTNRFLILKWFITGVIIALGYGWLLKRYTNAFAPFLDSVVLSFSILGQFMLMGRRYETWWCWLLVDSIAVPLYLVRGLHVTALLYAGFWINAVVALVRWKKLIKS